MSSEEKIKRFFLCFHGIGVFRIGAPLDVDDGVSRRRDSHRHERYGLCALRFASGAPDAVVRSRGLVMGDLHEVFKAKPMLPASLPFLEEIVHALVALPGTFAETLVEGLGLRLDVMVRVENGS